MADGGEGRYGLHSRYVIGMRVDATSYADAVDRIMEWASRGESRAVFACSVNNVMECHDDPELLQAHNVSDLNTPDGVPLVWSLRRLGVPEASRVYGPNLTLHVCAAAAAAGVPIGFYGGSPDVLAAAETALLAANPGLDIAYRYSPPFRELSPEEETKIVDEVIDSGARIVFVGLGCPKQEWWIARHRGRIPAVMLGVGAAFDFVAGAKKQAPRFMQDRGLEWLFRLATEPRRLWRRYLRHNPRFVVLLTRQLLKQKRQKGQSDK